jgi:hypothetical protein
VRNISVPRQFAVYIVPLALLTLFVVYNYVYLTYGSVPGNNKQYPLGWWGWFDQGQYWKSAKAFISFDLTPSSHFYPPLYPLIGALFIPTTELHPFYVVNFMLMAGYFLLIYRLFRPHIGPTPAALIILAGMLGYPIVALQWIIPWTSTLSAFLIASALFLLDRFDRLRKSVATARALSGNAFLFGLVIGTQIPVRPADIATVAPAAITYAALTAAMTFQKDMKQSLTSAGAGVAGFAVPVLFSLTFNLLSAGTLAGTYFQTVTGQIGFDPTQIPERLFSLIIVSQAYFLEFDADWVSVIPIYFGIVVFAIVCIAFPAPLFMRVAGCMMIVHLLVYSSYRDSVPTGMFRFFNIHYYKWMFPIAFGLVAYHLRPATFRKHGVLAALGGATATLLILSVSVSPKDIPITRFSSKGREIFLEIAHPNKFQLIDLPTQSTDAGDGGTAITLQTSVTIDGEMLRPISDYRAVSNSHTVRLILYRPRNVGSVVIHLSDLIMPPAKGWSARVLSMPFVLDVPFAQQRLDTSISSTSVVRIR